MKETQLFCAQCNRLVLARKAPSWRCTICGGSKVSEKQPPRWRLGYNGGVTEPFAPAEIRRQQKAGMLPPDVQAQSEAGGAWMPLGQAKLPPDAMPPGAALLGCLVIGFGVLVLIGMCRAIVGGDSSAEKAAKSEATALEENRAKTEALRVEKGLAAPPASAGPRKNTVCKVQIPKGDEVSFVPLFPAKDDVGTGIQAMGSIKQAGDLARFVANTGAIMVARGTPCAWMDVGVFSGVTQVRVLDGTHAGRVGWAPTEWVSAEE